MESRFLIKGEIPVEFESLYPSNKQELVQLPSGKTFDVFGYKQRVKLTIETLLWEAELRAIEYNKKAYVHVVGFGLGVWMATPLQTSYFIAAVKEVLSNLTLKRVAIVDLSYLRDDVPRRSKRKFPNGVQLLYSRRDPADKIDDEYLLVASYAWDGNSFPGMMIF
jgi:hypothetical protein